MSCLCCVLQSVPCRSARWGVCCWTRRSRATAHSRPFAPSSTAWVETWSPSRLPASAPSYTPTSPKVKGSNTTPNFVSSTLFLLGAFFRKEKNPTITVGSFLVGAFSLKEKSPTITVGSFFSADNLTLNSPLFLQFLQSYNFYNSYLAYEVVFLNHLRSSTGHCETFFNFFLHKRVSNSPILLHFEVLLLFLSIRYGADLGRSRLVY